MGSDGNYRKRAIPHPRMQRRTSLWSDILLCILVCGIACFPSLRPALRSVRVASRSHRGLPLNYSPNGFLFSKFFIFLRTSACHEKCVAWSMLLLLISSPRTARRDLGKIRSGSCKPKREERPPILKTFGLVSLQLDSSPITSRPGFSKVPSFIMQTKSCRQLCVMSGKIVTI